MFMQVQPTFVIFLAKYGLNLQILQKPFSCTSYKLSYVGGKCCGNRTFLYSSAHTDAQRQKFSKKIVKFMGPQVRIFPI